MTTTARTVDEIAALIREIDPDGILTPSEVGGELARSLKTYGLTQSRQRVAKFVWEVTPPLTRLPATGLAKLIVAEFGLGKEHR